ncbi:AMP-binding protein [Nonomuraea sp. SBT364]|uniref:AMP-binding protein n=1 Tax=Nonomuraea sp. SBT364 TaxID=1580530 RepID=UPI00066DF741|nr:AMP-binding protein [Nonomuraea sp. SBT364]
MPVAAQVLRHASSRPGRLALSGPAGDLSYGALARRAERLAARLAADRFAASPAGTGPAPLVAIRLADPVDQLTAVLAVDLLGGTPLLCDPAREIPPDLPAALRVDAVPPAPHAAPAGPSRDGFAGPRPSAGDLAWACFSSGSTGRPRAVVRTRGSWTGSFRPLSELTGIAADDVVLVPGPLISSLYAFAAVHALAMGATALVPGRWSPGALAGQLSRATAVHLVPHRLPELLAALPAGSPLRVAAVGGAALPDGVRERAGIRVMSYYGATELSFVAVDTDGTGLRPFPGVEIDVRIKPGRKLGTVWARSPWLAEGYVAGATGPLLTDGDGWMSVGDLAEPYRPGDVLRLRGRGDGAIQTGGATVVPEDVEQVLRAVPGVGDIVVIGSPHPDLGSVVTAIVEATGPPPPRSALEAVARGGLDLAQRPRRWYTVQKLPRTATGKPARALVAARLADGDPGLRRLP